MSTFELSPKFDETFQASVAYIGLYNFPKAIEFTLRVERLIEIIVQFPESYRTRAYLPSDIRRCSFRISARYQDEYAIFYEFDEARDHVFVHAIFPGFFDFSKIFKNWQ